MKLFFGNTVTTVTTLMIAGLLGFVGWSAFNRDNIAFWGRRSAFLLIYGLVVCCFAAARDGLDKTIQCAIDGNCEPGHFPACQYSDGRRLRRRPADSGCRRCHADCKDSTRTADLVLSDVGRSNAQNPDHGDCQNFYALTGARNKKEMILWIQRKFTHGRAIPRRCI